MNHLIQLHNFSVIHTKLSYGLSWTYNDRNIYYDNTIIYNIIYYIYYIIHNITNCFVISMIIIRTLPRGVAWTRLECAD